MLGYGFLFEFHSNGRKGPSLTPHFPTSASAVYGYTVIRHSGEALIRLFAHFRPKYNMQEAQAAQNKTLPAMSSKDAARSDVPTQH